MLSNGANVNSANKYGLSPLDAAGQNGHVEVVQELLK
jgi:ankyrin repeat protein